MLEKDALGVCFLSIFCVKSAVLLLRGVFLCRPFRQRENEFLDSVAGACGLKRQSGCARLVIEKVVRFH